MLISQLKQKLGDDEIFVTLLSLVLDLPKSRVLTLKQIPARAARKTLRAARRYKNGTPLAYATGKWYFYELPLRVNKHTLIPRYDTEILTQAALSHCKTPSLPHRCKEPPLNCHCKEPPLNCHCEEPQATWQSRPAISILDLCTGSGCIAVALAKNLTTPHNITAADKSRLALRLARANAHLNNVRIEFVRGDLFQNLQNRRFDIVVCNPPYIATREIGTHDKTTLAEPRIALDGGADGLDFYRKIATNSPAHLNPGGALFLETDHDQAAPVKTLLLAAGFSDITITKDLNGLDRVIAARYHKE